MADSAEEEPGRGRGSAPSSPIIPLQRTLVRRVVQVFSAIMLLWFGVYLGLNDRTLGRLISKIVTSQVRGTFTIGNAHYDYWSSLGSLILNTAAPVYATDFELRDPKGDLVMSVRRIDVRIYIGELIRGLLRSAVSAPFGRGVFIELHASEGHLRGGSASIHPINLPRPPGVTVPPLSEPYSEINIVSTMSGRKPQPEGTPPGPGHVRIVLDGAGVEVEDVTYEMAFPGWHGRVEKLRGVATLRFSTDASETRPGLRSFYYEVAPLTAERGTLVLGTPEGAGEFVFPLENIALRRFGARANRRQDLVFRGQLLAAGATVEIDGKLVDTYCDPGVKLQMSFEHGAGLVPLVPGGLLRGSGRERGRVYISGALSSTLPQTPTGKPALCLAESWHTSPFPADADERAVVIEGQVAGVDALVATIPVHDAGSQFRLAQNELLLTKIVGSALGGEVRAEPMRISFVNDMAWSARITTAGADPAQVVLVPPFLRPYASGKLNGGFRISGHLSRQAHPERVSIEKVEATLDRLARHDPLPRELRIGGSFLYTPEQISWRNLRITGETLVLDTDRGRVAIETGKLDVPVLDLHGKGAPVTRIVQSLGVDATVDEAAARLRLSGSLSRPEVSGGELSVAGFDYSGRRFTEASTGFALRDGTLEISKLSARGPLGTLRGDGSVRLFFKDLATRPIDPAITMHAEVEQLTLEAWNKQLPVKGLLDGQIDLAGTLGKPTGSLSAKVPQLSLLDSRFREVAVAVDLTPELINMRSLQAALGSGLLNAKALLRRDGDKPVRLVVEPSRLPLRELPGVNRLPFDIEGTLGGLVNVLGSTQPLSPRLDGRLQLNGFTINGKKIATPVIIPDSVSLPSEREPLFTLLGMAVRTLTLNQGELAFKERNDGGTYVRGTLFGAFEVEGVFYLDPARPRGEVSVRFGCPQATPATVAGAAASPATNRAQTCDLPLAKLLPDLRTFGDVSVSTSGVLTLRFGDDPRALYMGGALAAGGVMACPVLGGRPLLMENGLGLPIAATLQLHRALLEVHTVDEDGEDQRYRLHNNGDVFLCSDGRNIEMGRVLFASQRTSSAATPTKEHSNSNGEVTLRGLYSPEDTNLQIVGQIRLELLEDLLRSTFRHTHGDARVNLNLRGKVDNLKISGRAELQSAHLLPHAIETPIDIPAGVLEMTPERATLRRMRLVVDGATTVMDGTVEVKNWTQLSLGQINFTLSGDISARLLQWQFAQNLAETRGSLSLRKLRVTGTFGNPEVEGALVAHDLFLNVRRFHELLFNGGTIAFSKSKNGGRITIGCPPGQSADCESLQGIVDGDGKVQLNGRIDHNGLGSFMKPSWYQALDNVRLAVLLDNIRHTQPGVYNVEISTPEPGLQLIGDRKEMRLLGDVEVVAGRYMQEFDFSERILSVRRVVEEETPFWEGDPFLSGLILGLNVRTRGTFRVLNTIADLRLATTHFTVSGPVEKVAMGGVIRVESGYFQIPGLRGEFEVRGDSKLDFSTAAHWPDTPWVDVRGNARELDQYDQQRNIELALRGKVSQLRVECLSSENMSANDCASFLVFGDSGASGRNTAPGTSSLGLQYGNSAAKLLSGQLLTSQVTDPLRQKLRLDTVRIQFGVSTFDVQLCKRFGLYVRMCGLAEWGVLGSAGNHYRGFGELLLSDLAVGQVSLERIEHSLSFLRDTINRFKMQAGLKLPLRY